MHIFKISGKNEKFKKKSFDTLKAKYFILKYTPKVMLFLKENLVTFPTITQRDMQLKNQHPSDLFAITTVKRDQELEPCPTYPYFLHVCYGKQK